MSKVAPLELADLIRRPIVTEKATRLLEDNKYTFEVVPQATKPQVKAAIEALFDVRVTQVNSCNLPPKKRRMGKFLGWRPRYKKVVVTLAPGDKISLFPDV